MGTIKRNIAVTIRDANRSAIHRATDISLSHVSRILSGDRLPSSNNLEKLADALEVDMKSLIVHLRLLHKRRKSGKAA